MTGPTIGILAVQGDVREHRRALESVGARAVLVRRERELDGIHGLVIPGGESTVIDKLLRAFELFDPMQARLRDGLPAFGSCAGMILLADRVLGGTADQRTLGGLDITVRRNAFGRQVDSFEADIEYAGWSRCVRARCWRRRSTPRSAATPASTSSSSGWSPGSAETRPRRLVSFDP